MNRRERRQQERDQRRNRTIALPEGRLLRAEMLTPLGVEEVTNFRKVPAKRTGVHRWMCVVSHYMTDEQAEAFSGRSEESQVLLDASSVMGSGIGCMDCEGAYEDVVGQQCPAGDEWKNA